MEMRESRHCAQPLMWKCVSPDRVNDSVIVEMRSSFFENLPVVIVEML